MLGVLPQLEEDLPAAQAAASALNLPLLAPGSATRDLPENEVVLEIAEGAFRLRLTGRGRPGPVAVTFDDPALAHRRRAGHNELLGRAVGWRAEGAPRVLDGTAGFGRDAFVLADLGCEVLLCERHPVMAFLLRDAIVRSTNSGNDWLQAVGARMHVSAADATTLPTELVADSDVIYLDPMFAVERKAAPGKEMQLLQRLAVASPVDDERLLRWALAQKVRRVVVKRARRAPTLPGPAPGFTLSGRAVRFDVYPLAAQEMSKGA